MAKFVKLTLLKDNAVIYLNTDLIERFYENFSKELVYRVGRLTSHRTVFFTTITTTNGELINVKETTNEVFSKISQ